MNVSCPQCRTTYRVDPARVPEAGVSTRCRRCGEVFAVRRHEPAGARAASTAQPHASQAAPSQRGAGAEPDAAPPPPTQPPSPAPEPASTGAVPPPERRPASEIFGAQDPGVRAKRLARALVSDIVAYHRDKHKRALASGSLRSEFRDEIVKSWEEYVEQVGEETAKSSPHFRDALNEILAGGQRVF